jgi:hypothetical protein
VSVLARFDSGERYFGERTELPTNGITASTSVGLKRSFVSGSVGSPGNSLIQGENFRQQPVPLISRGPGWRPQLAAVMFA